MRCDPVRVTGYVDGELPSVLAAEIERHVAMCPFCAAQAAFEINLHEQLRSLSEVAPPPSRAWVAAVKGAASAN